MKHKERMAHEGQKEQISLYLSGLADKKTESRTEAMLMRNSSFLDTFVGVVEQRLYMAPPGFSEAVMSLLTGSAAARAAQNLFTNNATASVKVPMLSRKLSAAVCFCSAAAIMIFTFTGLNRYLSEFISAQSGKFSEWITFIQNLTLGGK